jgi:hypothetical protein
MSESQPLTAEDLAKLLAAQKPSLAVTLGPYVLMIALFGAGLWYVRQQSSTPVDPARPTTSLVSEAKAVFSNAADSEYFSHVCAAIATAIETDGQSSTPRLTTREQASEALCGAVCRFTALRLDTTVEMDKLKKFVGDRFDEPSEFPQTAGPLSKEDRSKAVSQFNVMAKACSDAH